jgi:hypothetical protein
MGLYLYCNPKDENEIVEVIQSVHDKHEYFDENGVEWQRVFTIPTASISTKIDPFDGRKFVEKTSTRDSLGSIMDRSREMSEKRSDLNGGVDPLREKHIEKWKKSRNKKKHPSEIQRNIKIVAD